MAMLSPRSDPFPFDAVRDLLGILRAMYRAAKAHGAGERRLGAIRELGLELRAAVDLALEYEPGSLGYAAAWKRAERATQRLADLVDCTTPLEPTLFAAADRVRAKKPYTGARELSRRARISRG
jgi:hypothetical protein